MFDLKSVAYVREYFQDLQKYEHDEEAGIVNIEDTTSKYSRPFKPLELIFSSGKRHSINLDVESEVERPVIVEERFLTSKFSAKSFPVETSTHQEHCKVLSTDAGGFDENCQTSFCNSSPSGVLRGQSNYSWDALQLPSTNPPPQTQQRPQLNNQQRKIQCQPEPTSGREQFPFLTSPQTAYESTCCYHSSQERLPHSKSGGEYNSIPFPRRRELVGRLTPLRESTGHSHASYSSEANPPTIVLKKTRRSSKNGLIAAQEQALTTPRLSTRNRSISLFISSKPNLYGGRASYPYFLGRYKTPRSSELRSKDSHTCTLLQGQQTTRSSSAGTLRHLPIDPEAKLHIGTKNQNISFSSSRDQRRFDLSISYRLPKKDDTIAPTMAPNFVMGPYSSHRKDRNSAETVASVGQSPFNATHEYPIGSEINYAGRPAMNSSSMANAGSQESCTAAVDEFSRAGEGLVAPSNSPSGEMTEIGENPDTPRRNYGQGVYRDKNTNSIDIEELFQNLEKVSVSSKAIEGNGARSYIGGFEECKGFSSPPKDSNFLGMADPNRGRAHTHDSSFCPILQKVVESSVSVPNDQAYVCTESSGTVALPRSASSPSIPTQPKRSVSFAENCSSVASGRTSQHSRGSISWADPVNESPIICANLRGPSYSADFEERMMTLPYPPVEHVVPVRPRGSSTASPPIVLSEKPRELWFRVKELFTGCCSPC